MKAVLEEMDESIFEGEAPSIHLINEKLNRDTLRDLDVMGRAIKEALRISPPIYGKV